MTAELFVELILFLVLLSAGLAHVCACQQLGCFYTRTGGQQARMIEQRDSSKL